MRVPAQIKTTSAEREREREIARFTSALIRQTQVFAQVLHVDRATYRKIQLRVLRLFIVRTRSDFFTTLFARDSHPSLPPSPLRYIGIYTENNKFALRPTYVERGGRGRGGERERENHDVAARCRGFTNIVPALSAPRDNVDAERSRDPVQPGRFTGTRICIPIR